MSKGVEIQYMNRVPMVDGSVSAAFAAPPYVQERDTIMGRFNKGPYFGQVIAAIMHDYYAVSAEEQRQMALNTIALCELKYNQQEIDHV